ncbi:MAG: hypothetical protein JNL25_11640, partial [Rhodospirillaceae bacterium]|nr:hypothetical protein [Rhodospirillaceae bacterium]
MTVEHNVGPGDGATTETILPAGPIEMDWQSTLEPELGQLVEQKGWRSPSDVLSSYRHLERLVGAERIVLPAPDAEP